jgi:hypothetical protein
MCNLYIERLTAAKFAPDLAFDNPVASNAG